MRCWLLLLLFVIPSMVIASDDDDALSGAILQAEQALLLHRDRTTHMDLAVAGFADNLQSFQNDTTNLVNELERLVRLTNVRQLQQLSERLNDALQFELERRAGTKQEKQQQKPVTESYLDSSFDPVMLFAKSEAVLEKWVRDIMEQEIESLVSSAAETGSAVSVDEESNSNTSDESCVSPATAAQEVQSVLLHYSHDGIGRLDHALGGVIVHEMTSPTFVPPAQAHEKLGYWRRFIPDDIEEMLPTGWKNVRIPLQAAASPQTVLHADTRPGACWPLQGSEGFVTFRLPYPVHVDAVTVDHTSERLLVSSGRDRLLSSAPKQLRVYGYPPCEDGNNNCEGLGFDASDGYLLKEIHFDAEGGSSTQTFSVSGGKKAEEHDAHEAASEGSCSATTATCSEPVPDYDVAAVRVEVVSNWGNEAYTCLYRFRVHGVPLA